MADPKITQQQNTRTVTNPNSDMAKKRLADQLISTPDALQKFEDLANDPQYQRTAPPDTQQELRQAIEQGKANYEKQANLNDWLDVAQTLSGALAQYGAAQAGLSNAGRFGNPMSGLNINKVDYKARNDRAFQQYSQGVQDAGKLGDSARQNWADTEQSKMQGFKQQAAPLEETIRAARERDSQAARLADSERSETRSMQREAASDERQEKRLGRQEANAEIQQNNREISELSKRIQAGETLANQLQQDDLSKKNLEKLQMKYGNLAGQAGVNLPEVLDQYEKGAPREASDASVGNKIRSVFGAELPVDKPAAHKNLLQYLQTTDLKQKVEDLKRRNRELVGAKAPAASGAPQEPTAQPAAAAPAIAPAAPEGRVTIYKDGKPVGTVPKEQIEDAKKQGYTVDIQ